MVGRFVTFEGIDGCGKTTVSRHVVRRLRAEDVEAVWTCEPTGTWLGRAVKRGYAEGVGARTEAFLFMADRAEHIGRIRALMGKGKVVVSDRYFDSTLAYQAAGLEMEQGQKCPPDPGPLAWLREAHRPFLLLPDLTVYLRISPGAGIRRLSGRSRLTKFERAGFLKRVAGHYDAIAALEPDRVKVVDASLELEAVVQDSLREVRKVL